MSLKKQSLQEIVSIQSETTHDILSAIGKTFESLSKIAENPRLREAAGTLCASVGQRSTKIKK